MKAPSISLLATLAVLCLSGCASTQHRSDSARVAPPLTPEQVYIAKVERLAARRGIDVVWVNPPKTEPDSLIATR